MIPFDKLREMFDMAEALVAELQHENVVLRAERDEARQALDKVLTRIGGEPEVTRGRVGAPLVLGHAEVASVNHLSVRDAAAALGVSKNTVQRARQRYEMAG